MTIRARLIALWEAACARLPGHAVPPKDASTGPGLKPLPPKEHPGYEFTPSAEERKPGSLRVKDPKKIVQMLDISAFMNEQMPRVSLSFPDGTVFRANGTLTEVQDALDENLPLAAKIMTSGALKEIRKKAYEAGVPPPFAFEGVPDIIMGKGYRFTAGPPGKPGILVVTDPKKIKEQKDITAFVEDTDTSSLSLTFFDDENVFRVDGKREAIPSAIRNGQMLSAKLLDKKARRELATAMQQTPAGARLVIEDFSNDK